MISDKTEKTSQGMHQGVLKMSLLPIPQVKFPIIVYHIPMELSIAAPNNLIWYKMNN